jgi:hypothetical protein
MYEMKNLLILVLILMGSTQIKAQSIDKSVVASAGTVMVSTVGQIQFTVGEIATATLIGVGSQVSQGFNQGLNVVQVVPIAREAVGEVQDFTDSQKAADRILDQKMGIEFNLFPNPTSDFVHIARKGNPEMNLNFEVVDIKGQTLNTGILEGEETRVDFTTLASGSYLVFVRSQDGSFSKTYRVVKSK